MGEIYMHAYPVIQQPTNTAKGDFYMMKKRSLMCKCSVLSLVLFFFASTAYAQGVACDSKKINECCAKLEKKLSDVIMLKAKLESMIADIKTKKKLSAEQVEKTMQRIDSIDTEAWTDVDEEWMY